MLCCKSNVKICLPPSLEFCCRHENTITKQKIRSQAITKLSKISSFNIGLFNF